MRCRFKRKANRLLPSSLVPLFQNESKCETFHMKMSSACSFIFIQIKVMFIRMISHLDSLWNRGRRELGNGLFELSHTVNFHIFMPMYLKYYQGGEHLLTVFSVLQKRVFNFFMSLNYVQQHLLMTHVTWTACVLIKLGPAVHGVEETFGDLSENNLRAGWSKKKSAGSGWWI